MHFDVTKLNSLKSTMISRGVSESEMVYFMVAGKGYTSPFEERRYLCYFASSVGNLPTNYSKGQWAVLLEEQFNENSYYQETLWEGSWDVESYKSFIKSDVTHGVREGAINTARIVWNDQTESGEFRPILESSGYQPLAGIDLDGHNVIDLVLPDDSLDILNMDKNDEAVNGYVVKTDYSHNWNSFITPTLDIKIDLSKMTPNSLFVIKQYVFDEEISGEWLTTKSKFSSIDATKSWNTLNTSIDDNADLEELKVILLESLGLRHLNTTLDGTFATLTFRSEKGKSRHLQVSTLNGGGVPIPVESQSTNMVEDGDAKLTISSGEVTGYWVQNAFIDYVNREKEFVHFKNMDPTNELKVTLTPTDEDSVIETRNDAELKWVEENGERNFCLMNDYCQDSYHNASFVIDLQALEIDKNVIVRSQDTKELLAEATIPELSTWDEVADIIKGVLEKTGLVVTYNPYPLPIDGESASYEFVLENNTLEYISFDLGIATQGIQEHQYVIPENNQAKLTITNKEILDTDLSIQCCLIPAPVKHVIVCAGAIPYTIIKGLIDSNVTLTVNDVEYSRNGVGSGYDVFDILDQNGIVSRELNDGDPFNPYRSGNDVYLVNTTDNYIRLKFTTRVVDENEIGIVAEEQLQLTPEQSEHTSTSPLEVNVCLAPFNGIMCIPTDSRWVYIDETELTALKTEDAFIEISLGVKSLDLNYNYISSDFWYDTTGDYTLEIVPDAEDEWLGVFPRYIRVRYSATLHPITGVRTGSFQVKGGYMNVVRGRSVEPIADGYEMNFSELIFNIDIRDDSNIRYMSINSYGDYVPVFNPFSVAFDDEGDANIVMCNVTNPHIVKLP